MQEVKKIFFLVSCILHLTSCLFGVSPAFAEGKNIEDRVADLERRLDDSPLTNLSPKVLIGEGDRGLSFSGYIRFRGVSQYNFDLNKNKSDDNYIDFVDVRSYLTLEVEKNNIKGVVSVDIAGDNFNDGVILGYDDPAKNRPVDVNLQYLYLEYNFHLPLIPSLQRRGEGEEQFNSPLIKGDRGLFFSVGRMPAKIGHGIVANITRDMLKIGKRFDDFQITGVWVKGGEGVTQNNSSSIPTSRRILNDPDGSDHDLDLYGVVMGGRGLSLYAMRKFDTSMDKVYPEKIFIGLSADGRFNNLRYSGEITYMGGNTQAGQQGASSSERAIQNAYMLYMDGAYEFDLLSAGLSFGMGSGDNNPSDKIQENFQNLFMDEVGFHYTYIYSDDIHGYDGRSSDIAKGSGFANTAWVQAHISLPLPLPLLRKEGIKGRSDVTIEGSYTYLYATKEQLEGTGPLGDGTAASDSKTRDIGQEIDIKVSYSINNNTDIKIFGGVFFPGSIYGRNADSALKGEVGIEYKF